MARLPLTQSQGQAQGANSQLLNTQGIDVAAAGRQQALQSVEQAGRALTEEGMVFAAIQKKKQQAVDLKSEMAIKADYNAALAGHAMFQAENPPELWEKDISDRLHKSFADSNKYEMTENNREMVIGGIYGSGTGDKRVYGQVDTDIAKVHIDTVKRITDDNIKTADAVYYSAMTLNNPNTPDGAEKIANSRQTWYKSRVNQNEKISVIEEQKLIRNANIQRLKNEAVVNPDAVITKMDSVISDDSSVSKETFSNEDAQDIKNYAGSVKRQNQINEDKQLDLALSETLPQLTTMLQQDDYVGIQNTINKFKPSINISPVNQEKYATFIKRWKDIAQGGLENTDMTKNVNNYRVIDKFDNDAFKVSRGEMTRDEFLTNVETEFYVNKAFTPSERDKIIKKLDEPLSPIQQEVLNRYYTEASELITGERPGILGGLALTANLETDKTKVKQYELTQKYKEQVRDWIIKHDGDVGPNLDKYATDLKIRYNNMSPQQRDMELGGTTPTASPSSPQKVTVTNKKTGETLELKDGKWQPMK